MRINWRTTIRSGRAFAAASLFCTAMLFVSQLSLGGDGGATIVNPPPLPIPDGPVEPTSDTLGDTTVPEFQ